jgi:intergrase/recombinase
MLPVVGVVAHPYGEVWSYLFGTLFEGEWFLVFELQAACFSTTTLGAVQKNHEKIEERAASHYYAKYGYVTPKHLRKFAFDKMIELGILESVADFIEGRTPKKIGAKHYMALLMQTDSAKDTLPS